MDNKRRINRQYSTRQSKKTKKSDIDIESKSAAVVAAAVAAEVAQMAVYEINYKLNNIQKNIEYIQQVEFDIATDYLIYYSDNISRLSSELV